jgi:hypothetical protein
MKTRIITALAFSLSLGTAAVAQTTMETDAEYGAGMPAGWEGEISEALFEDAELGVLHSEADVRDNFEGLGPDQQAMIRSHCALVDTAAYDAGSDDLAQDIDSDLDDDVADLGLNEEIETGATDLEDLEPAADLETAETDAGVDEEFETGAADLEGDLETDTAADLDAGIDEEIETGAVDLESDIETDTAAGTSLDEEIETGATIGSTSDIETDVETGTEMGATSDLDSEFETGEAELGVDSEIETGATGAMDADEFETETAFSQEMDGTMDGQITASIEQVCAWID